jgi:PAS domain S-box-containing protein
MAGTRRTKAAPAPAPSEPRTRCSSGELLRRIAEGTASAVGDVFFRSLARNLAAVLGVRHAFIAEVTEPDRRVRTLAFWNGEDFATNFEYALEGTPCQRVLRGEVCHYPKDVQTLFPQDADLRTLGAQSYLAVPLTGSGGRVLGHLAVLDTRPMPATEEDFAIFKIFGARAGAELERQRLEEAGRQSESALRRIDEGTASAVGDEFFHSLVRNLAGALGVRHAFMSEFVEGQRARVRTLAFWDGGKFLENFEYDLPHTPCERVLAGEICLFPDKVQETFPEHRSELAALGVESYLAIPVKGADGRVLGHLAVMDTRPMREDARVLSVFKIFGARAGAELERLKFEAALQHSEARLRDLFDEAPIAYVHEGVDTRFISANRAAMKILGIQPEEIEGTYGKSFIPDTPEAQARLKTALEIIQRGEGAEGVVLELRRKDNGKPIFIQWWSRPDPVGAFTRTMFLDITERVLMEREKARLEAANTYLQEEIRSEHNFGEIVGNSAALLAVLGQVDTVAPADSTVFILGETGTGKELIARAIHDRSGRKGRALVKVNCGAISAGLVESELFGHVKGAFTGALANRDGRFKIADGGTIFLDEVGDLPPDTQVKLLRVLQEQEFEPIGSSKTVKVDVRIIAATNRDLNAAVAEGKFRRDLYYRLNVFPIAVPPLRERAADIPLLASFFLQRFAKKFGKPVKRVPEETMLRLAAYAWPGNIRELQNVIERAILLSPGDTLMLAPDFGPAPNAVAGAEVTRLSSNPVTTSPLAEIDQSLLTSAPTNAGSNSLEDVERRHIESVLARTHWMIEGEHGAAKILNLNPSTLRSRMKNLGIKRPS